MPLSLCKLDYPSVRSFILELQSQNEVLGKGGTVYLKQKMNPYSFLPKESLIWLTDVTNEDQL